MNMRVWGLLFCAALCIGAAPHHSHRASSHHAPRQPLTAEAIEQAQFGQGQKDNTALIVKAEVLLGRAGFSPGVIDGRGGDNYSKAIAAFQRQNGLDPSGTLNGDTFNALAATSEDPVMAEYEITEADVKGPFTKNIPANFEAMAELPALDYPSPRDELAERFHMSEQLLATLNGGADFDRAGARIVVTDVPQKPRHARVAKVVIDKGARSLSAFDHYDPRFGFKGVEAQHKFTIRPGPKNPVGLVWIDLTAPSYGIHGTPSPEKIGKTESHGCIRLTNWDALDLAGMVRRGTIVDFVG
jgi:lipoprotein-anchoring transpeptidase ErfK/SrfK